VFCDFVSPVFKRNFAMRTLRLIFTTVALTILLSGFQPAYAQAKGPDPVGLRLDAPDYAKHGPFWVGTRELNFVDGKDTVGLTVWYPALNPTNAKEETTYTITFSLGSPDKPLIAAGQAIRDAAPDSTKAPYPLILFSPGLTVWSQANSTLLEHLASYGFVVLSWNPRGETIETFWQGAGYRLLDPKLVITRADKMTATGGELAGIIDMQHMAVVGHSSGGWTALAAGGAQLNFGWCAANKDEVAKNPRGNCGQFVPHQDEIAAMLGLKSAPIGMWPATNDPRIMAVISMAGDGDIWGVNYEGISQLKVPTMVMGGSHDTVNVPEITSYPIYDHLGSAIKSRVIFQGGDHAIFLNSCKVVPALVTPDMFWACSDQVWEMDRVHDLINQFTTAFLLDVVKGDKDAHKALLPAAVTFPGIDYKTTMK
jgi:predicted dienelactone hydrolase